MRPVASEQDYLREPLNDLLGTPANVRLIRVLAEEVLGPVGASEAAALAGLTETGARQALKRLSTTAFVEQVGGGRSQRYRLRESDPLVESLRRLFRAEVTRYHTFCSGLREVFSNFAEVTVAWVQRHPAEPQQAVEVGVLADSRSLGYLREQLRQRVLTLEEEFDITIELQLFSRADVPEVNWREVTLLAGHATHGSESGRAPRGFQQNPSRVAGWSRAIAQMLDRDPSLLKRAQRHVELLLERDQGPAAHDLREWRDLLTHYSPQRIKDFLVSESPRAQRLRQSSPFFAVLSAAEREKLAGMEGSP